VQSLNEFDEDAKHYRAKDNNNHLSNRPNSQNNAAPKDAGNEGTSKGSKLDDVTRDKLQKDGKCFYCKEPGYMTNTCLELAKKKKADLKNLEFSGNNNKNVEEVLNKEKV
jgi:5-methylcytosine-specific restriction endonuclease McrA